MEKSGKAIGVRLLYRLARRMGYPLRDTGRGRKNTFRKPTHACEMAGLIGI